VALADIINRIEADAAAEAAQLLSDADARAFEVLEAARREAVEQAARIGADARRDADSEAATRLAGARLIARDVELTARRTLIDEAMTALSVAVEALPADDYVHFLGARLASGVRTGDSVAMGAEDAKLVDTVRAAVEAGAPGVELTWSSETAPFQRGALVSGPRTRLEVTPRSVIESQRDELDVRLARALFDVGEG
jgi:vacuolar-type H+-ATPase subunit E/Vma4